MGLRKLLVRNLNYVVTDTVAGTTDTFTILTPPLGLGPGWAPGAYGGGMSVPGAWRAATLIADLLGQLPWHAYRERAGTPAVRLAPTPPLLAEPWPGHTRMETFSSMALDLLWHGNAIAVIAARNAEGWPTAIVPVPACYVSVRPTGAQVYDAAGNFVGPVEYRVGDWRGGQGDVVHIKGPCEPGALRGMGILEVHCGTLDLAREQERQARGLANGGVPTGVLETSNPDTTPAQLSAAKTAWLEAQRTRTVAALAPGTKFTPLSWDPTEMQMVEARKFTLQQLALMFGIPGRYLGVEAGSLTYSTPHLDAIDLLKFTLGGHLARFEQEFSRHMPRGTWAKANVDAITRADLTTRYAAHATAIAAGFLTVDEVRALEDLPPLPAVVEPPAPDETVDDVIDGQVGLDAPAETDPPANEDPEGEL